MRIAIAQINPTLADFESNYKKIIEYTKRAVEQKCDLVLFPESALFGYHPFDLLEIRDLVRIQNRFLKKIETQVPKGVVLLFGLITENKKSKGRPYFNSAAWVQRGKKTKYFHKQLLPTGDVFDEARFIEHGETKNNIIKFFGKNILITICEDIWAWPDSYGRSQYQINPLAEIAKQNKKIDLVLNLSASPYFPHKENTRDQLLQKTSKLFSAPMFYCNMVGAQDEIIFDGQSFAVDKHGKEIARLQLFSEDIGVVDLNKMIGMKRPQGIPEIEKLRRALVLGLRDFCYKTGLQKVHLGLSGGIDSALVACLAVDALGANNVHVISLPTKFNAQLSFDLAKSLSQNLGLNLQNIEIEEIYESFKVLIDKELSLDRFGLVHENLQARIRGLILMAYSNKTGSLLLSTSNKTEAAAGYSTLYGDMCGGLMPIGDLTKKQVYELCRLYNKEAEVIPLEIIERAPSAELRPNQKDQDSLPPYEDLDTAVENIVVHAKLKKSKADQWLLPMLLRSEFKRWQAPPILKVSEHSFGRGRRWPIAHRAVDALLGLKK